MKTRIALAALVAAIALARPASATLTSTSNTVSYTGNGSATSYTVPFKFLANTDLVVTVAGSQKTINVDYTVSGAGNATGTVKFTVAPAAAQAVVITRVVPLTQTSTVRQALPFPAGATIDTALDKQTMLAQQNAAALAALTTKEATDIAAAINPTPVTVNSNSLILATGSSTSRALGAMLSDVVSVKDFLPIGQPDGTTDNTAGIQAAWNAVVARGNGKLYFPCGTYMLNAPISVAPSTPAVYSGSTIEGESEQCAIIKAGTAMTAMFLFTDTGTNGRFYFRSIMLHGNFLAQYGIKSAKIAYSKFEHLDVGMTTVAAVQIQDGWDNTFRDCQFHDGTGDGLVSNGSNANDLTLINVLFSQNTGWGLKVFGGGPIALRGGAIQGNQAGGIYVVLAARPFLVDAVYFEANAQTGFAFTSPVKTVKADILINGTTPGTPTSMNHSFPSPNVTVRNCLHNATYSEAFVYAVAASAMTVLGNYESATAVPLVKTYGDNSFAAPANVATMGNFGFSQDFAVESVTDAKSLPFSTFSNDSAPRRNYLATKNVYAIPKILGSAGTVIQRGAVKYNGRETFDVTSTLGDIFGVTINTTVTTELANALVYISAWAKSSSTSAGPRLMIGAKSHSASFATDLLWHHIEFADVLPAAGSAIIGFGKYGATAGDVISYADVVVAVVGSPDREFNRDLLPTAWSFTAAPTTGTWAVGDRVFNSVPSVGAPKSWVCTVAGAPGTWVSEGNL